MNIIEDAPAPHEGFSQWIAYDSTGCPLDDGTRMMVKTAEDTWEFVYDWYNGSGRIEVPAGDWRWNWDNNESDIVAFSFFLTDEDY